MKNLEKWGLIGVCLLLGVLISIGAADTFLDKFPYAKGGTREAKFQDDLKRGLILGTKSVKTEEVYFADSCKSDRIYWTTFHIDGKTKRTKAGHRTSLVVPTMFVSDIALYKIDSLKSDSATIKVGIGASDLIVAMKTDTLYTGTFSKALPVKYVTGDTVRVTFATDTVKSGKFKIYIKGWKK